MIVEPLKGKYAEYAPGLWCREGREGDRLGQEANEVLDDVKSAVTWLKERICMGVDDNSIVADFVDDAFKDVIGGKRE